MKRILFYINGIYRGGIEIALYNLVSHLDKNKYKIFVTYTDKNTFKLLERKIGNYCKYVEIDKEINVDTLIYCNYVSKDEEKHIKNIKCKNSYFWFHCFGENQERFLERVCKENLVDKIITVCNSVKQELLQLDYLKGKEGKVITIKNILNSKDIKIKSKEKVDVVKAKDLTMITIARLVKEKGFERVKVLLDYMKQQNIDYKFLIVGTANTEEEVVEIKNMFQDDDKVIFLGYQENPYKYLRICDYNVLLSDRENMSLSMMEAKILGVPNIVTDFESAFEEVTDEENGFILSRYNTSTYREKIQMILNEKQKLKDNLKNFKYDIDEILNQWEELIMYRREEFMKDRIIKCLAHNGKISVICAETTKMVEEARKTHDMSPVVTAAFGRLLTMTSIMATEMKNEQDKLTVQIKGNGPIGIMLATADNKPTVKGYVTNPIVDIPLNENGKLDVGGAVGYEGYINVIKDIGLKDPYIGISPLVSGEIAEDFANYFVNSEQRDSAVALGVLVDKNGVRASGGYLINPMPDATEEEISKVEQAIFKAGAMSRMLDQNLTLEEIAKRITGYDNIKVIEDEIIPEFKCDCSKEHMKDALASVGKKELEEIINTDGKAEIVCHFCNKKYNFNKEELQKISENIK